MTLKQFIPPPAKPQYSLGCIGLILISLFLLIFCTCNVNAENVTNSVPNTDTQTTQDSACPTEIQSDTAEFSDEHGTATYRGHVIATQGSRQLFADTLIIYRSKENAIAKILAKGNPARVKAQPNAAKPTGNGKANIIEYYPNQDKADLIGEAELEQGGDLIRGSFLTYFFAQGLLLSHATPNGRTTVILQPRN